MSKGKAHERGLARARERREQERRTQRRRRGVVAAILVVGVFVVAGIVAAMVGRDGGEPTAALTDPAGNPAAEPTADDGAAPVACGGDVPAGANEEKPQFDAPPEMTIHPEGSYRATIETSCGAIVVDLFAADAPETVNNFVFLAREGFYDGLTFHRLAADFVIQGGDPAGDGTGGPGYRIGEETVLPEQDGYQTGSLAMAKAQAPSTTGSQFFIVLEGGAAQLQPLYSLFGQVIEGMDAVERIAAVPKRGQTPLETVYIERVTIEELPTEGSSE